MKRKDDVAAVAAVMERVGLRVTFETPSRAIAVKSGQSGWVGNRWVVDGAGVHWEARMSPMQPWTRMKSESHAKALGAWRAMRNRKRIEGLTRISCGHMRTAA